MAKKDHVSLTIDVTLLEKDGAEKVPKATAYAFSKGGRLLSRAELSGKGRAELPLPAAQHARAVRLVVGPDVEGEPRLSELLRRGAEERTVRIDPESLEPRFHFEIIPSKWLCWLHSLCFVPGTLLKRQEIDGIPVDLPVCDATVEVYEVDPLPLIVARLPDDILRKFREFVTSPFPPVGPPPPPLDASRIALPRARMAEEPSGGVTLAESLDASAGELRLAARTASAFQFRDVLLRYPDFTRFLICRFYPGGVTKTLVATAKTDECGHFRAVFFRGCNNADQPDLYFKARQRWAFFDVVIYEPLPVTCYTRWNYSCGTEVTLFTTSPLARTCSPCAPIEAPGQNWVAVMHVGNTPLSRIRGTSVNAGIQGTTNATNRGLVFRTVAEANDASSFDGRPFGGLLRPHLVFDNSLREDLGVEYYRVSWRKGTSGAFQPLVGEVHRHYSYEPPGGTTPVFEVYSLGPKVVGSVADLFEIPPALPPKGQWVTADLVEDQTSAKFPTATLAPAAEHGKYQIKIDLFDASGNLVNVDALQILYVVPEELDLSAPGPVHTADASSLGLVVDEDADGKKSFLMTVHVDNNECGASIDPALLGGPANPCGVLEYDPTSLGATVTMPYTASHPNGFATYRFRLKRGVTPLGALTETGTAIPPGNFSQTASVSDLLGGCPVAAISEDLEVWALATDGWSRMTAYDADDHAAFVLSPEETD